jgi:hypothetical protein
VDPETERVVVVVLPPGPGYPEEGRRMHRLASLPGARLWKERRGWVPVISWNVICKSCINVSTILSESPKAGS